jgi:WD40 repeat protein
LQPKLPRDLETICLKCLEKEPARRYAGASELADELGRFLRAEPIRARPLSRLARLVRWGRRNPALSAVGGLAVLAVLALVAASIGFGIEQARSARNLRSALDEAKRLSARATFDRGVALCEQGVVDRGMLWMARSLQLGSTTTDAAFERVIRANLAGWAHRLYLLRQCLEHDASVRAIAFSPDGRWIATGSADRSVRLWDAATGRALGRPLAHPGAVRSVRFSPDGGHLLTVASGGPARLWSHRQGEPAARPLEHPGSIRAAAFSPDGQMVLTAGGDGSIRFWNASTGKGCGPVLRHRSAVVFALFSPDGKTVLSGSTDRTAALWEVATGMRLHECAHPGPLRSGAFRADGTMVVTGDEDRTAIIWHTGTGRPIGAPLRHDSAVTAAVFSPDGRLVLTSSADWRARL